MKRFYERYKLAVDLAVVSLVLMLFVFVGAHVTLTTSRVVEKEIAPALTKTAEKAASALEELSSAEAAEDYPSFTLAWSEYPSWSTFGVAHEVGIINGEKGKLGPIEKKWGVDIVLVEADYDPCITGYASGQFDASCLTNMDVLNPALGRKSVAIAPTSTSYGADACIVTNDITDIKQLKGKNVYMLAKSVSEYAFCGGIEALGGNTNDYTIVNMDPAAAALAMQQRQDGYNAIMVWNPFVLETLNKRKDVHDAFNSTKIPAEIIDMVIMGQDSVNKPKGREFACAVIETFYAVSKLIANPETHGDTVVALGEKFSHLGLKDMEKALEQTIFFATPEQGISLYTDGIICPTGKTITTKTLKPIMEKVVDFCIVKEIIPDKPKISYGTKEDGSNLRFDPSFMQEVLRKQ